MESMQTIENIMGRDLWGVFDQLGNLIHAELAVDEDAMWYAYFGRHYSEEEIIDALAIGLTACKLEYQPADPVIREKLWHAVNGQPFPE